MDDRSSKLRDKLLGAASARPATGLARLWKTGRSAAGMASAVLGGRFRGRGDGLEAADLDAVARLVERLGELKGVAMKAGQILSYVDPTLSPELRSLLSVLQTASSATPFSEVERSLRRAFAERADDLLRSMDVAPIAVASIGQVHRATLPSGLAVAVKVRHAGIEQALASDFMAAGVGGALASSAFSVGGATVRSFIDEARTAMLEECDYLLEAARQQRFSELFATDPDIVIPPVESDWCARGVLTTGWRPGTSLDSWLEGGPSASDRDRMGEALFRFYVGTLYRHGLFHADPHPGNYGFLEDGRVVIYDFGCVRTFDDATTRAFAALVASVRDDDTGAIGGALQALGAPRPRVTPRVKTLLRGFFAPLLAPGRRPLGLDEAFEARTLMQDKRALMELALPGKLLFLFRLRFGLYAVLARMEAEADWAGLESQWADAALARS